MNSGETTVAGLCEALRSPDPVVRDEQAYPALLALIPGLGPQERRALGDLMAERFQDAEIQARTFAPLILARLVREGAYEPGWLAAFARWYPAETDLRGYHPQLGWLHAVAHGADLLGALGRFSPADAGALLDLGAARLLAPTGHVLDAQEDDRLAFALAGVLTRADITARQSTGWLDAVERTFAGGEPGPVPAEASNTMRTLRMLYLLADRGVRPRWDGGEPAPFTHRDAVRDRLAEVLAMVSPYLG